ncbi:hypothetical protein AUK11_02910 [bacterium CG2_30_37_16]|nr:MAG: hypothetical protein AUK11_02910 [bacterium CG2_30_37_16]PIP30883.1 MAG: hypothetical protein COX25_02250 [bacterium (Candidatus Howlettbacteria) CG23_combo_of_CG06-09_8_20_14_all_37_9]PIX99313.1 MAG: hypothetical protein COZ22_02800 [bacterium (Candidatus Howlettbacteria) CG_4_10_14_3_um_filter_37_10]PJB06601.1 MAG: hypothetical protein CO123_01655 [bacterium (Candidatus Howlettbacteria) CG_4_9_14_3_um_filter_37_10]
MSEKPSTIKKEIILPVIVVAALVAYVFVSYRNNSSHYSHTQFEMYKSKVIFDLYEPGYLPEGFVVSGQSLSESKKIQPDNFAFFAAKGSDTIWFTESKITREIDLKTYLSWLDLKNEMIDGKDVYFGKANGSLAASFIYNGTWVSIRPMQQLDKKELIKIIQNLRKS